MEKQAIKRPGKEEHYDDKEQDAPQVTVTGSGIHYHLGDRPHRRASSQSSERSGRDINGGSSHT
jgi:hypothetical protein